MFSRFNINKIEAIFADIDGSTRGKEKFAKGLPIIANIARLIQGIPIFPVTARDPNGWLVIKDFNKVFGTRKSVWFHSKAGRLFRKRRLIHPNNVEDIKKYIRRYGCVVLNNGGTIASLDGSVIFRHYTFQEEEKQILKHLFDEYITQIDSIELSGKPGGSTKLFLFDADEVKLMSLKKSTPKGYDVYSVGISKEPGSFQILYSVFEEIFANDSSSKIGISLKNPDATTQIVARLDLENLEITSNEGSLSLCTRGINKRSGIEWIEKHLNLNISKCIFIGNDYNDIPALTYPKLGIPIIVGNSSAIVSERLERKYGKVRKEVILVENYDELFKALQPLLTSRKYFLREKESS